MARVERPRGARLGRAMVVVVGALLLGGHPSAPRAQTPERAAAIEASWARYLFDFLPAIDACLGASPEPASVLRAWPMNRGMVGMRLVDVVDAEWDCVAAATGGSVEAFEPAADPSEPEPPVEPVFTRAPGAPPPAGCYEHEEVADASGEVVGWLSFHVC